MDTIFALIILLFSTVIHEIAHGSVANLLGDSTAKNSGRLSLNPLKHLDPFGSILLPLILYISTAGRGPIFGWAKPVPVNPFNLRDHKWGMLKVSVAGPLTNFLIALIFGLLVRFLPSPSQLTGFFSLISIYNLVWALFNLIPIPPLDGSHVLFFFLPEKFRQFKEVLGQYSSIILILFIVFGLNFVYNAAIFIFSVITGLKIY